jgi:two-component system, NtrC family, sensor kinase
MRIALILILVTSLGYFPGSTQTRQAIDSLHHQLTRATDDIGRINAQVALCLLHRLGNTDSSLIYGQQALETAIRINYFQGQISALGFMAIVMEQQGNLPKSLELGFKALQLAEEHDLENLSGPALDAIGEAYITLKDYAKAISYLRRYILNGENGSNDEGLAYAYFDMGAAFAGLNALDSAIFYEQKSIETFAKYNYEEPLVYQVLGDIKMKSGNLAEALSYYQRSLALSLNKNEPRALSFAFNKIASFYKEINKPDSAIYYASKGLEESKKINQKRTILDASALLSQLYEAKDARVSLEYLKMADAYKDSIFGAGNIEAVQALITRQEERQKEIKAARTEYRNQLKEYGLIAGVLVLLVIAFFLYRNTWKEKKAKQLLQNKNEVIEQTLENLKSTQSQLIQSEKMASLGELTAGIAHEIQNPLNFVNNFSELNNELIEELKSQKSKLKSEEQDEILNDIFLNNEKIAHHGKRADAIVKGMLQHSRSGSGQKELTEINVLADEYLRLAYHGLRAKDKSFNAKFETDFDPGIGKINIIPQDIGRVLLNLFTNAFYSVTEKNKHHPVNYEPCVYVSTRKIQDKVEIKVKDNGMGIPSKVMDKIFQPFFTTKPTGVGTGLGLSLSYDIITKGHNGQLAVETKEGQFAEFTITLPPQ